VETNGSAVLRDFEQPEDYMTNSATMGALLLTAVAAGWGVTAARATGTAPPLQRGETAPRAVPASNLSCAGGQDPMLEVKLTPAAIVSTAGQDALQVDLKLINRRSKPGKAKYVVEVVTDQGQPVTAPVSSASMAVAEKGAASSAAPAKIGPLADGFYQVRVTAAALSGKDQDTALGLLYLRSKAGKITPIEVDEYLAQSAANQEVTP
jgi:hypothetical protein